MYSAWSVKFDEGAMLQVSATISLLQLKTRLIRCEEWVFFLDIKDNCFRGCGLVFRRSVFAYLKKCKKCTHIEMWVMHPSKVFGCGFYEWNDILFKIFQAWFWQLFDLEWVMEHDTFQRKMLRQVSSFSPWR